MKKRIKILMIDDHPMILVGYQNTLLTTKEDDQELEIDIASNCDEAVNKINIAVNKEKPYDMLFIDIKIPPTKDGLITSGEGLAIYAKLQLPTAKIVILTMFNEPYRINNIINNINPDGFLIKSDLTFNELSNAFKNILKNPPFYSVTVQKHLKNKMQEAIVIDTINHKILQFIAQGLKLQHIADNLDISLSTVEKRKKHLKELLNVNDNENATLINRAKEEGLILN